MKRSRHQWIAFALLLSSGCGGEGANGATAVVVRDSAGITIVESPAELAERDAGWTVASEPELSVGVVEGDDVYQLFRIQGAAQLGDGTLVVVNGGTQELRFYDPAGRHVRTVGGRGAGPGEFQFPRLVAARPDSFVVSDMGNNRYTFHDASGAVSRSVTPTGFVSSTHGWLGGDRVLVSRNSASAGLDTPEGVMPNHTTFTVADIGTGTTSIVAELPGERVFMANTGSQISFTSVPYDGRPSAAGGEGGVYLTPGRIPEIHLYDSSGELVRIQRVLRSPRPLSQAEFDRTVATRVDQASTPELKIEMRRRYDRMPTPETIPEFSWLLIDDTGHLWARRFSDSTMWSVFDPAGHAVGTVTLPRGLGVQQIGADFILASRRDDLGVEYVVRYALTRQ
jgi:hypothetical protein